MVRISENGRNFSLTIPKAEDWYAIHVTLGEDESTKTTYGRFWGDGLYGLYLPKNVTEITVVTQDLYGNTGEAVVIPIVRE